MRPTIVARVFLALAFLAAPLAYSSWMASQTVFDPSATRSATHALLAAPSVRSTLARQIRTQLTPELGHAANDPKMNAAIDAAVSDPRFAGAFADAIASVHARILSDKPGRVTLDTRAVTDALHEALVRHDPAVASRVHASAPVHIRLGSDQVPHLGGTRHSLNAFSHGAAAIACLLVAGALLLAPNRQTIGRVGRRTALLAVAPTLLFAVLPRLLDAVDGDAEAIIAAILRAYAHRIMPSAAVLAVIGLSMWLIALALPRARDRGPDETPSVPAAYNRAVGHRATRVERTAELPEKLYL